jgi:iron complex outermembrane receptor protein
MTTFYNMVNFAEPSYSYGVQQPYVDNHFYTENYMVGDQIKLNAQWALLAGGNFVVTKDTYFLSPGVTYPPASYNASKLTPSASLIYKPVNNVTTYFTYQQSLQPGQSVLNGYGVTYTNAPSVLPPYLGHQYELGVKATIAPGILLTAALFDIDKANIYTINNSDGTETVAESGRQVNKGVELTASGKVQRGLTILGGITLLNPKITNDPQNTTYNGQNAATTASASGKLYAEYAIPRVKDFMVNGGIRYSGSMWIDFPNTLSIPAYSVEDFGARYTSKLSEISALTYRFNINNLTNKAYWQGGSYLGAPRTVLGTIQLQF